MNKLLSLGIVVATAASLTTACGGAKTVVKTTIEDKKEDKKEIIIESTIKQGTFKLAVFGTGVLATLKGKEELELVNSYSIDTIAAEAGTEYLSLPNGLSLKKHASFNFKKAPVSAANSPEFAKQVGLYKKALLASPIAVIAPRSNGPATNYLFDDKNLEIAAKLAYVNAKTTKGDLITLFDGAIAAKSLAAQKGGGSLAGFITVPTSGTGFKLYDDLKEANLYEAAFDEASDKMNSKGIDVAFMAVVDEVNNTDVMYKALVEKKLFKGHLVMTGKGARTQSGSKEKTFANAQITTAVYSTYVSAYIAGFQSAVKALKWDIEDKKFEEVTISYLIGADDSGKFSRAKASAFRHGVEAAAAHKNYKDYLTVTFVSKTNTAKDEKGKKLYYGVGDWAPKTDGKDGPLYQAVTQGDFPDGEVKIAYITGLTATNWDAMMIADSNKLKDKFDGGTKLNVVLDEVAAVDVDNNIKNWSTIAPETACDNAIAHKMYLKSFVKGYFLGGPNYMIGKHTTYGGEAIVASGASAGYGRLEGDAVKQAEIAKKVKEAFWAATAIELDAYKLKIQSDWISS